MKFSIYFTDGYIYEVDAADIKAQTCKVLSPNNIATFIRPRFDELLENGIWVELWETLLQTSQNGTNAQQDEIQLRKESEPVNVLLPFTHCITKFCILDPRDMDRVSHIYMDGVSIIWRHYFEDGSSKLVNGITAQLQIQLYNGSTSAPALYNSIFDTILKYREDNIDISEVSSILNIDEDVLNSVVVHFEKKLSSSDDGTQVLDKEDLLTEEEPTELLDEPKDAITDYDL